MKKPISEILSENVTMNKGVLLLVIVACFMSGLAIGFLCMPIKGGLGSNNGNVTNNYYGEDKNIPAESNRKVK